MFKMVAIDLDDTLLNDQLMISEENMKSIKKAIEFGTIVCIVSGRSYSSVQKYIKELQISHLCGSLNGAIVTNPKDGKSVFSQTLDSSIAHEILKETHIQSIHVNYYHDYKVICQQKNEITHHYMKLTNVEIEFVSSLKNYNKKAEAGKLLLIDNTDKLELLRIRLHKRYNDDVNITYSKPNFLEIYNKNVSKGEAVKKIGAYYGLSSNEIIAIGDGENDIPMIEYAGLGIAMGNSNEKVKSKANYVTFLNNENGVAHALEKFILNNQE